MRCTLSIIKLQARFNTSDGLNREIIITDYFLNIADWTNYWNKADVALICKKGHKHKSSNYRHAVIIDRSETQV